MRNAREEQQRKNLDRRKQSGKIAGSIEYVTRHI